jgi:DNA mismatch repair protein MSH6
LYDAGINKVCFSTFRDDLEFSKLKTIFAKFDIKEVITESKIRLETHANIIKPIKGGSQAGFREKFNNENEYSAFLHLYNYMECLKRENFTENVTIVELNEINSAHMALDNITLRNMEILQNNYDYTSKNSLITSLNYCLTPHGQRLLRKWILNPLMNLKKIEARQNIALVLEEMNLSTIREDMKKVGDIERIMTKVFTNNPTVRDLSRFLEYLDLSGKAIKRFITLFVELVGGIDVNSPIVSNFVSSFCRSSFPISSNVMASNIRITSGCEEIVSMLSSLPEVSRILGEFEIKYKIDGNEIYPGDRGDELNALTEEFGNIKNRLAFYLEQQKEYLGCDTLRYRDLGKEIFQIEVPKGIRVPPDYIPVSGTSTIKRYYTAKLKSL